MLSCFMCDCLCIVAVCDGFGVPWVSALCGFDERMVDAMQYNTIQYFTHTSFILLYFLYYNMHLYYVYMTNALNAQCIINLTIPISKWL